MSQIFTLPPKNELSDSVLIPVLMRYIFIIVILPADISIIIDVYHYYMHRFTGFGILYVPLVMSSAGFSVVKCYVEKQCLVRLPVDRMNELFVYKTFSTYCCIQEIYHCLY